jgi:exo-beta-1,3-glucanase (GH17 family)
MSKIQYAPAICYSGYREGQSPREGIYPGLEEIHEDLKIVEKYWSAIRLYDISPHAERVLETIRSNKMNLKVFMGTDLAAEVSNPDCPWGAEYSDTELAKNRLYNDAGLEKLIYLVNEYEDIVIAASIGNEASVEWTDHLVPVERLMQTARKLKDAVSVPVTFCENYVPWTGKLKPLVELLDVISIHTYPLWEYKTIDEALEYTKENYTEVAQAYPEKQVIITEAGWCTKSNGRSMHAEGASEQNQMQYIRELTEWTESEEIPCFLFEAFDEPWKGSEDPMEPEKHWGLFYENRIAKPVMEKVFKN